MGLFRGIQLRKCAKTRSSRKAKIFWKSLLIGKWLRKICRLTKKFDVFPHFLYKRKKFFKLLIHNSYTMQDFLQKYTRHNIVSHLSILWVSFVLAVWIYFFIGDSNVGNLIKTNVREANQNLENNTGDIYLEKNTSGENEIFLKSQKNISQVKAISLTITYNPENLSISSISELWGKGTVQNLSNTEGIATIFLQYENPTDINSWDYLLLISGDKKEEKLENINILNANFRDISGESYILTTSGIDF